MNSAHHTLVRRRTLFVGAFLLLLGIVSLTLVLVHPPLWLILLILAVAIALAVTVIVHARLTKYRCPDCGEVFKVSSVTDFVSPHYPHKKLLKCPKCRVVAWCEETK